MYTKNNIKSKNTKKEVYYLTEIEEFAKKMEKVMLEKIPKYGTTWLECTLGTLKGKLNDQVRSLVLSWNKEQIERAKRVLIHIANYCYLISLRLE